MPLEVQGHTVSVLKALNCGKLEPRGLRCGSIFVLCHALLKKAILLHREGVVPFVSLNTVFILVEKVSI